MKQAIFTQKAPKPVGPYSQAILINDFLFISGQIPTDPESGQIISGSIEVQTRQVMANIKAILNEAKMDFSNIIKSSIFLTDMNNFSSVNEVYAASFGEIPPARECIQAARLPKDADIEISVIAAL
jgi:2-iminobutanoate/2-iminopropanoate deaminase